MSGNFIENTKKVTVLLLDYLFKNFEKSKYTVFTFNDQV